MARYFFHTVGKDMWQEDFHGVELPDLAAAHLHALRLVYRMLRHGDGPWQSQGWSVRVCSSAADPELVVLFPIRDDRLLAPLPRALLFG